MPSTFAHDLFGRKVYALLTKEQRQLIRENRDLYYLGLHGPDLLFYYRPLHENAAVKKGVRLHREEAYGFFAEGLKKLHAAEAQKQRAMAAYLLGFACHFALDSACHGKINRLDRETVYSHAELETELDRRLLLREWKDPLHTDLTCHLHDSVRTRRIIGEVLCENEEVISAATVTLKAASRLFVNTGETGKRLILLLLRLTGGGKFQGMIMRRKPLTGCEAMLDDLEELFDGAVEKGAALLTALADSMETGGPLPDQFRRNFE